MASYSDDELRSIVAKSISYADVLRSLGLVVSGSTHRFVRKRIERLKIDINHFSTGEALRRAAEKRRSFRLENVFCENSVESSQTLRRYARKLLTPAICCECKNPGIHNGKSLVLQIDHKNGTRNDNRIENLRWLCPNCHSQTETYSRVRRVVPQSNELRLVVLNCHYCKRDFKRRPSRVNREGYKHHYCSTRCNSDALILRRKVDPHVVRQRYAELGSKSAVAKELGVSFQAIAKILKKVTDDVSSETL